MIDNSLRTCEPLVFISAAEQSADRHGADLIRATRAIRPDVRFVGVCGPRMVEAGCECLFDMSGQAAMLLSAFKAVGRGARMLSIAERCLRMSPFDACVVIDSPVLHLRLAQRAHAAGVPVLYYIAPQLWAWGANRIYKLRHNVDRLAAILPFEEEYFRAQGVEAAYVGHPLVEQLRAEKLDASVIAQIQSGGSPMVALLPGSRTHVIEEVLRGQLEVAAAIAKVFHKAAFGISVANEQARAVIEKIVAGSGVAVRLFSQHAELIEAADLVLVASGTTALEVLLRRKPMIVMYNTSRLFYHLLARWMLRTEYLSLPNILAKREIVPEFMPYYSSTAPITRGALDLLRDDRKRADMIAELDTVAKSLGQERASQRTAVMLLELLAGRRH